MPPWDQVADRFCTNAKIKSFTTSVPEGPRGSHFGWKNGPGDLLLQNPHRKRRFLSWAVHPGNLWGLIMWAVTNIWKPRCSHFQYKALAALFFRSLEDAEDVETGDFGDFFNPKMISFCKTFISSNHSVIGYLSLHGVSILKSGNIHRSPSNSTSFFTAENSSNPRTLGKGVQGSRCPQQTWSDTGTQHAMKTAATKHTVYLYLP